MRILVVDDDRLVTSSLKTILKSDKGIEVTATRETATGRPWNCISTGLIFFL